MDSEGGRWVFPVLALLMPLVSSLGVLAWGFAAGYAWAKERRGLAAGLIGLALLVFVAMAGLTAYMVFDPRPMDDMELPPSQHRE